MEREVKTTRDSFGNVKTRQQPVGEVVSSLVKDRQGKAVGASIKKPGKKGSYFYTDVGLEADSKGRITFKPSPFDPNGWQVEGMVTVDDVEGVDPVSGNITFGESARNKIKVYDVDDWEGARTDVTKDVFS